MDLIPNDGQCAYGFILDRCEAAATTTVTMPSGNQYPTCQVHADELATHGGEAAS